MIVYDENSIGLVDIGFFDIMSWFCIMYDGFMFDLFEMDVCEFVFVLLVFGDLFDVLMCVLCGG